MKLFASKTELVQINNLEDLTVLTTSAINQFSKDISKLKKDCTVNYLAFVLLAGVGFAGAAWLAGQQEDEIQNLRNRVKELELDGDVANEIDILKARVRELELAREVKAQED